MFIHLILIELEQWTATNAAFIWPAVIVKTSKCHYI
jgi:hypothetical protein